MSAITSSTVTTDSGLSALIKRHPLATYFLVAFLGTWLTILPMVLGQDGIGLLPFHLSEAAFQLIYIGACYTGPLLAAVLVTAVESGRQGVGQFLRRIVQWRVGFHWYLIALFSFVSVWLVTFSLILDGAPVIHLIQNPSLLYTVFLPSIMMRIFIPSLGEEPGWRGFALPRLQTRFGPLQGTVVLGFLHGLWHLPVFFTALGGGFSPNVFLAFMVTAIAGTFIYTWIFNHTRASILIAILIHAASNASNDLLGALIPADAQLSPLLQSLVDTGWLNAIAFGTAAVLLIVLTRGRLGYMQKRDN